jgi:hypothetical protein
LDPNPAQPPQGHEINRLLGIKPSAVTRTMSHLVMTWQLENPTASKDECAAWLVGRKEGQQGSKARREDGDVGIVKKVRKGKGKGDGEGGVER